MKRAIGLAMLVCLGLVGRVEAQVAQQATRPTISVSGTAEIRVAPDEVNMRLAVETRDPKLDEAVKQNDVKTAAVLKFLKEAGVPDKDVQTDYVEINPQYHDRREQQLVPEYYQVRRSLGVRVRKVALFDHVMAGVLRSGVNYVLGIDFRTNELRKHRDAARQQAIRAAKEKAIALAEELGVTVGKAQAISEETGGGWGGMYGRGYNPYGNVMSQNVSQVVAGGGDGGEGNLSVGMISVTATVNVTFALE